MQDLQETIRFAIPGTQWIAIGITTEQFELICRGYVQAFYEGTPDGTSAGDCHPLRHTRAALTRTGLDTLVDEATGYQYARAEDALQPKLRVFIGKSSGGSPIGLPPCRCARSGGESW